MVPVIGGQSEGDTEAGQGVSPEDTSPLAAVMRYVSSVNSVIGRDRSSESSANTTGAVSE